MTFTFTCKKVALSDSIKEYAERKISKLERYFHEDVEARVVFSVEKEHRCTAEITLYAAGMVFRSQEESADGDMRGAIDTACAGIDRQIRKNKTRLSRRLRQEALEPMVSTEFDVGEDKMDIVRTKQVLLKPMTQEEAILQMNLLGHDFFLYRNEQNVFCVVYRRKNGGYGILEADGVE